MEPEPKTPEDADSAELDIGPIQLSPAEDVALNNIGALLGVPLETFATVRHFDNAEAILAFLHSLPLNDHRWAFRGHKDATWKLEPSIERLKRSYPHSLRSGAEEYVRQAFKRRAHHYLNHLPLDGDELEWMALMRHHGAPTRLLDWTRSPYVAAFFAIAEAVEEQESAIWAIDVYALRMEVIYLLRGTDVLDSGPLRELSFSAPDIFDRVFLRDTNPAIVAPVEPARTNQRAISQQGLFLCPNKSLWGFEFGLKQVLNSDRKRMGEILFRRDPAREPRTPERLFKLCIAPTARNALIKELYRMNINYATLFPDLDGFARSLATNITVSNFVSFDVELDSPV